MVVVMREPATTAEKAMVDAGDDDEARRFRLAFQRRFGPELKGIVEAITGREVLSYHSQILFAPDVLFELFVLGSEDEPAAQN